MIVITAIHTAICVDEAPAHPGRCLDRVFALSLDIKGGLDATVIDGLG